jgi:hypothetical protein
MAMMVLLGVRKVGAVSVGLSGLAGAVLLYTAAGFPSVLGRALDL